MNSFLAGVACVAVVSAASLVGGDTAEQNRDVGKFSAIHTKGVADVMVEVGPKLSVRVEADDDIIDNVITEVEDGTLVIRMERKKRGYYDIDTLNVYVTTPSLDAVMLSGSGEVEVEGLKNQDFSMQLSGSGDAIIEGKSLKTVDLTLRGSGDIEIEGACDKVGITLMGSGDIVADDLECKDAVVELRGSGDVEVFASNRAEVVLRGSGDIVVEGQPEKVISKVRGSGEVTVAD